MIESSRTLRRPSSDLKRKIAASSAPVTRSRLYSWTQLLPAALRFGILVGQAAQLQRLSMIEYRSKAGAPVMPSDRS
jgi:hypothetical protein